MIPILTAFAQSPDRGRGLARDFPVRWALEEVGQSYEFRPLSFFELKEPPHRARHPFGQIPTYEADGLTLFESAAIVLHLGERHPGLLPADPEARARAIAWMFAAKSTIEPPVVERSMAFLFEREQPWFAERQAMLDGRVRTKLDELSARLGNGEWLDSDFSAGDLVMIAALRRLHGSGLLEEQPAMLAYVARGEARPAFQRAFAAQLAVFAAATPPPAA